MTFYLFAQLTVNNKNDLPKVSNYFRYFCDEPTSSNETVSNLIPLVRTFLSVYLNLVEVKSNFDVVKLKELVDVLDSKRNLFCSKK